jgi:hypothetical protein
MAMHHREFVAAQPADAPAVPGDDFQPLCDFLQQLVANPVAHRVIDQLEAIEIDQQERAFGFSKQAAEQSLLQQFANQQPVGDAGQRIGAGGADCIFTGQPQRRNLRGDPAPADDLATIKRGFAGQRPPPSRPGGKGDVAKFVAILEMIEQAAHAG